MAENKSVEANASSGGQSEGPECSLGGGAQPAPGPEKQDSQSMLNQHRGSFPEKLKEGKQNSLKLRLKWPFTEWETGPEQKSRKNGKENEKWPHA